MTNRRYLRERRRRNRWRRLDRIRGPVDLVVVNFIRDTDGPAWDWYPSIRGDDYTYTACAAPDPGVSS